MLLAFRLALLARLLGGSPLLLRLLVRGELDLRLDTFLLVRLVVLLDLLLLLLRRGVDLLLRYLLGGLLRRLQVGQILDRLPTFTSLPATARASAT